MNWLISIFVNAILFLALDGYLEGFEIEGFTAAILASFVLSLLNGIVRPILIIFTLPVTILSLGLFLFVINAITLLLTDAIVGSSFEISSFGMALLAAVILSIANIIIQNFIIRNKKRD
ncbi:membrane protein [Bacillus coahuilensis m2-6]|uniref:Membrane protein n=1 Tax=Bacillus coahuilensis p1.1.43 TaxID=1150625 RepID=A0A147K5X3_9BACI|nr:phage holin family protein [Bacillus coahuilensis]KUP05215.1 membrane protein [Bacillus coahuilensis p1.1.43]KUP05666.1 membrane protein [Bacillus coahuilensis m2-6]